MELRFASQVPTYLIDLPWSTPLDEWDHPLLATMAQGTSRHVVRFVSDGEKAFALKETNRRDAEREYHTLRDMRAARLPVVEAAGLVNGRRTVGGEPLAAVLVTRFLDYSLPFRYLFGAEGGQPLATKLIDAAVVLLVRAHVEGFYWGDCSLSNLLFRRDAGALMAYLVDAETSEHHSKPLSERMRSVDLDLAKENIAGGMMDLAAEGRLSGTVDLELLNQLSSRYTLLWNELTGTQEIDAADKHLIDRRIRRINELGFDVGELVVETGERLRVIPTLVEEGHHARELGRMTGLQVQENQARRLLNDICSYGAYLCRVEGQTPPPGITAARWIAEVYEPIVSRVPEALRGRLEPAELFHELLEHRYYLSEAAGYEVDNDTGLRSYLELVLSLRPAEQTLFPDV